MLQATRWKGEDGKVSTLIQSASPGLNAPNPTDHTVVDIIRIAVLYEYLGKMEVRRLPWAMLTQRAGGEHQPLSRWQDPREGAGRQPRTSAVH